MMMADQSAAVARVRAIVRTGVCRPISRCLLPREVLDGLEQFGPPVRFHVAVPSPLVAGPWATWDQVAIFPEGTYAYRRWVGRRFDPPPWDDPA
jgi:hypothetical protein